MTSLVIPVADEARNFTLPLVLQSVARHAPWLSPILIGSPQITYSLVSHHPNAIAVPFLQQYPGNPVGNTTKMLQAAIALPEDVVTDPFVWSNDDIYFNQPVDLDDIRVAGATARGSLKDLKPSGLYGRLGHATNAALSALGLPTWDYERHVPLVVHKQDMSRAIAPDTQFRSMYQNRALSEPAFIAPDVKVFLIKELTDAVRAQPFFSTGNRFPIETIRIALGL